jgi:hypothetical protein
MPPARSGNARAEAAIAQLSISAPGNERYRRSSSCSTTPPALARGAADRPRHSNRSSPTTNVRALIDDMRPRKRR